MKLTSLLFQCVLLVLLLAHSSLGSWFFGNTMKQKEKTLNQLLIDRKYCSGQLAQYSEYILKLLLREYRFALEVYIPHQNFTKGSSEGLRQLVEFLHCVCEASRPPTRFTFKHFLSIATAEFESKFSGLESDVEIIDAIHERQYDPNFVEVDMEIDDKWYLELLNVKIQKETFDRESAKFCYHFKGSELVEKLLDNFKLYYNDTAGNKFAKLQSDIEMKNKIKFGMLWLLDYAPTDAIRDPPSGQANPIDQPRTNQSANQSPRKYCGLSGKCLVYSIIGAFVGFIFWGVFFRQSQDNSNVIPTSFPTSSSSSSRAPITPPTNGMVIVAVLVLIAIALGIFWYYKKYRWEASPSAVHSTTHNATRRKNKKKDMKKKDKEKEKKKERHKKKSNKDSSPSPSSTPKKKVHKHKNVKKRKSPNVPLNKKHRSPKRKSPKSSVQPSDVPTALIGPSDYEHLFDGSKANNKLTETSNANHKQSKASLIGTSGSSVWNQAVTGQPSAVLKISSPIPSIVPVPVTDRKKANLKPKSPEPKTNVISSGLETNDRASVRKKK